MFVKLISSIAVSAVAMVTVAMWTPASAAPDCRPGFKVRYKTSTVLKCGRAGIKAASFGGVLNQAKNANCQGWLGPQVESRLGKHTGFGQVSYKCWRWVPVNGGSR
jgi:hypothetical protein